jgi:hypothetical protein
MRCNAGEVHAWWIAAALYSRRIATAEMAANAAILNSVRVKSFHETSAKGTRSAHDGQPAHLSGMPPLAAPRYLSARRNATAVNICMRARMRARIRAH